MAQLSSKEIYYKTGEIGVGKTSKSTKSVFYSAILAGIFISLGCIAYYSVVPFFPDEFKGLGISIGGVLFSIGILLVLMAGADLYTGNALVAVGCYQKRYSIIKVIKNNLLVLGGNLTGTTLVAFLMTLSDFSPKISAASNEALLHTVEKKIDPFMLTSLEMGPLIGIFASAILCNIIVAVIVWMSYAGENVADKALVSVIGIAVFVVSGYEHVVANGYYFSKYVFNELFIEGNLISVEVWIALFLSVVVVAIGNFIGGAIFIGGMYHKVHFECDECDAKCGRTKDIVKLEDIEKKK